MLTKLYVQAVSFLQSREGVTAIEYAVVAVAIAGIVGAVFSTDGTLKTALDTALTNVSSAISTNTSTTAPASGG